MEATLRSITVRHFRCFEAFGTEFDAGLNLIVGPNAHGKTSILEAVCILLRLQSPRVSRLAEVVQHDKRGLVVDGYLGDRRMQFYYSSTRRKLALDGVEQMNPREYLMLGRLVYFAMQDIDLVRGSADGRRRFMDFVAMQMNVEYRPAMRAYERAMRSRNALLKAGGQREREIDAFTKPLLDAGEVLIRVRAKLIEELLPHAAEAHRAISGSREDLALEYVCGAGSSFEASLAASRVEDMRLRQTCVGPHRDDVRFRLNGRGSEFASEGQQRTIVLALKLGAARLLEERFGAGPLLLLDDIFGELDTKRRVALLEALPAESQKLITTTTLTWLPSEAGGRILRLGDAG